MALGVFGFGCEDSLLHLMNYVWPNIFETSPHMMQSFNDAVEGFRVSVGPGRVMLYTLQVGGAGVGRGCFGICTLQVGGAGVGRGCFGICTLQVGGGWFKVTGSYLCRWGG